MSAEMKTTVWIPPRTMAFVTPKGLAGVAVAVLATALCILSILLVYIYYRRTVRTGSGPRSRRGKGMTTVPLPVVDAELIVDDYRRGNRSAVRRQLPWLLGLISSTGQRPPLFPDNSRSLPFSSALERLWSRSGPTTDAPGDDLPDVAQYADGQANAAGPRFLATTASGKSLQVVVKTAAVASRQPQQRQQQEFGALHSSRSWQADSGTSGTGGVGRHLYANSSSMQSMSDADAALGETRSVPVTSMHSDAAAQPLAVAGKVGSPGPRAPGLAGQHAAGKLSSVASRGHTASAALDGSDTEGEAPVAAETAAGISALAQSQLRPHSDARETDGTVGASGRAGDLSAGGTGTGDGSNKAGTGPTSPQVGRGGDNDPAAAWYSRALHRQVSAAAAAAQAAPKVHVA